MSALVQSDSTYSNIEKKIRRLTAAASQNALSSADIQEAVNKFYNNDFPYAIKLDQTRQVYKFLTIPNVDRYPVDINNLQGFRAPVYFEGVQGNFFKNRDQLFNLFPRFPTQFQQGAQTLTGNITRVDLAGTSSPIPTVRIVSPAHGLKAGTFVLINNVVGTTELNGNVYQISLTPNQVDSFNLVGTNALVGYSAYVSGGTWTTTSPAFDFTLFGNNVNPFPSPNYGILSTQVVIGGIDINGNPIRIVDDGGAVVNSLGLGSNTTTGQLIFLNQNTVGNNVWVDSSGNQQPSLPAYSPIGGSGMNNPAFPQYPPLPLNQAGAQSPQYVGTVNYVTTEIILNLPVSLMPGTQLNIWASTYQPGRPYNLLFWNNELTIRPVPDNVYLVEVEAYQTPVQFMQTTDSPLLAQWAQYISYGTAIELLRERQDMEGVENLMEGFKRQEALVLERQAIEEIAVPNITLFNNTTYGYGYGNGYAPGGGIGF